MSYTITRFKEDESGRLIMYKITFSRKPKKRVARCFLNELIKSA